MSWLSWAASGFVATVVLVVLAEGSQGLRLTRMSWPYLLGTMVTGNRRRAKLFGLALHFANGFLFSLVYVAIFEGVGNASWWFGGLLGLVHGLFVTVALFAALPGLHPRMAMESHGPTVTRQLEPPGFLGMNYGRGTPLSLVVSHAAFGVVIGLLYPALPAA